jgi:hypothetical protein
MFNDEDEKEHLEEQIRYNEVYYNCKITHNIEHASYYVKCNICSHGISYNISGMYKMKKGCHCNSKCHMNTQLVEDSKYILNNNTNCILGVPYSGEISLVCQICYTHYRIHTTVVKTYRNIIQCIMCNKKSLEENEKYLIKINEGNGSNIDIKIICKSCKSVILDTRLYTFTIGMWITIDKIINGKFEHVCIGK